MPIFVTMKLSVIIPVFRVETTLVRCAESVLSQSFRDLEVILVDDGSPDRCPRLCDTLAQEDARVRVVHQSNKGLGEARNTGIRWARGTYITFVDSDDEVSPGTYQALMDEIASRHGTDDLVEYPILEHAGNGKREHRLSFPGKTYRDMKSYWLEGEAYRHTYACNKIYRRTLFEQVRFPTGKAFEDAYTLPQLLKHCRQVYTCARGLYLYRWNPRGITARAEGKALTDLLEAHLRIPGILELEALPPRLGKAADRYYACVLNIQLDVFEETGKSPLLPARPCRGSLKSILLYLIGMEKLCRLNRLLHLIFRPRS